MRFQTFAAALVLIVLLAVWLNGGALDDRLAPAPAPAEADLKCRVTYVHDGDSLRCRDGARIRLHAVAARGRGAREGRDLLARPPLPRSLSRFGHPDAEASDRGP